MIMTQARKNAAKKNASTSKVEGLSDDIRVIKKYPNRRLYDTQTSAYVTLSDIKKLVMGQEPFKVQDAKTNEDLTRSILMQIILEEESAGMPIFSTESLKHIIRFYGHSLQGMMAPFLENNLVNFIEMQNQYSSQSQKLGQAMTPESWMKFMQQNATSSINPMADYMEQSKKIFEQMQSQTSGLFGGFPFTATK
jgi:polyhydroxyalkanoate synthesis repressor PhaR